MAADPCGDSRSGSRFGAYHPPGDYVAETDGDAAAYGKIERIASRMRERPPIVGADS
jgi:hypothetical protein